MFKLYQYQLFHLPSVFDTDDTDTILYNLKPTTEKLWWVKKNCYEKEGSMKNLRNQI